MSLIASLIKEQRHIFGICPHCQDLVRLVDVKVSYQTQYRRDWLDMLQDKQGNWEEKISDLEEEEKELRKKAIDKATRTTLPRLLQKVVPTFARTHLNPREVKTILHPINFVAFDGMNAGRVKDVVLMDPKTTDKTRKQVQQSIADAIKSDAVEWKSVRIGESGDVSVE